MDRKWNEKTTLQKTTEIISFIAFCVWMVFEILERTGKVNGTSIVSYVAILVICIAETIYFWNIKRVISYIGIGGTFCLVASLVLLAM